MNPNTTYRRVFEDDDLGEVIVTFKGAVPKRAWWNRHRGSQNVLAAHWDPERFGALMDRLGIDHG